MPEIIYRGTNIRTMPDIGRTVIKPGANLVSQELVDFLQLVPYTRELFEAGVFFLREPAPAGSRKPPETGVPLSLEGLKFKDIKAAVARCEDVALLKSWAETNGDPRVRSLLEARYCELQPDNDTAAVGPQ